MEKISHSKNSSSPLESLRKILSKNDVGGTQEDLRTELEKAGLEVNQSTISRCLRKLGAVKTFSPQGDAVYKLPTEAAPPNVEASIADLVKEITQNDSLIVLHTSPGSASLIARHLDHFAPGLILGTIAGDDTIFVAPVRVKQIKKVVAELKTFFGR